MSNKILILANSSSGLYDFRNELMCELLKDHHLAASIPAEEKSDQIMDLGCRVIPTDIDRRGLDPVKDLKLLIFYWKLLRQEKPDLVITYTIKPNVYGGLVCRMAKVPYAVNITGLGTAFQRRGLLRTTVKLLYKMALKKAKVVFFENAGNNQLFVDEKIVAKDKCHLLSGAGVNLERYRYSSYPVSSPVRFLFVGRVMKEKGIEELFSAVERLREEGENCELDVLGEAEENYASQISRYEAQGWLRYHGYQKDVRPFIEKAHCFVLPSYHEGMANTNLECASMGRPLITSDIPGCREAVVENVSGLLCRPRDVNSLYETMKRFLALSREQRQAMGMAGRAHMEQVFDKNAVVEKTVRALEDGQKAPGKKICLISTVTETNGAFLVPMAEYFHRHTDWDISLMCAPDDPAYLKLVPQGVRYLPMPMRRGVSLRGLSTCRRMLRVFRKEKFDMIQYCTPNASLYAALAGRMAGIRVRLYCQWGMIFVSFSGFKRKIFKLMEKAICKASTHVQPDSYGNLRLCHELGLYPEGKGSVVWNGSTCGIDLEKFDISKKLQWRQEIRRALEIPEEAMVFGFVGRVTGDKGVNELFTAFRKLADQDPNLYLMMIGPLEKEESVDMSLYRWASAHPRVRLCGFRDHVERYLAAMDCYVLPSYREGFGTSIIEAEAMELPVIATNIPGPTEAMCQDVTGILVPAKDTDALMRGMARMAANPAARDRFGKAGRRYVAERFELRHFLQATLEDRKRLLGVEE